MKPLFLIKSHDFIKSKLTLEKVRWYYQESEYDEFYLEEIDNNYMITRETVRIRQGTPFRSIKSFLIDERTKDMICRQWEFYHQLN